MTTFLVTEAARFIGSCVPEALVTRSYYIRTIDNLSTGSCGDVAPVEGDIEVIEGDIRSFERANRAVLGMDVIIVHFAALPSAPRSVADPLTTNEVNVTGMLNTVGARA